MAKLCISTSGRRAPERSRAASTCRTVRSRNVSPSLTCSSDFGPGQPHAGAQAAVELEHDGTVEHVGRAVLGQVLGPRKVVHGLELVLAQDPLLARGQAAGVVREGVYRELGSPSALIFSTPSASPSLMARDPRARSLPVIGHTIAIVTEGDLPDLLPLMRGYCDFYEVDAARTTRCWRCRAR